MLSKKYTYIYCVCVCVGNFTTCEESNIPNKIQNWWAGLKNTGT